MFDDGSRIMQDDVSQAAASTTPTTSSARGDVPLEVYYEVARVANEVVEKLDWSESTSRGQILRRISARGSAADADSNYNKSNTSIDDDGFLCRIALQFPDELLADAPDVSWLMEAAVANAYKEELMREKSTILSLDDATQSLLDEHLAQSPLLFILGDTTYGSCCADEVAANHLNAQLIVHYGYACLSPTESIPVVYAFGVSDAMGNDKVWKECVQLVSNEANRKQRGEEGEQTLDEAVAQLNIGQEVKQEKKILVLYEVKYHHAMDDLNLAFEETGEFQVVMGVISKQQLRARPDEMSKVGECCSSDAISGPASNSCASNVSLWT